MNTREDCDDPTPCIRDGDRGHGTPHVAACGDELYSVYGGTGRVNLITGHIEFELRERYTGGTGRFAGASGTTHIFGVVENGVARFVADGSITY